ncbi:MAG: undecaprenyl-diphosphate phosphatase [Bacteriovoracaceae bacterium]|nr:undecaprenyl-diphosphate phosphatase [Bacteriovoracaceae bacterium]
MTEWWALFYGLVQGITEFLPISSSGHLALIPFFFELKDPGVVFDLMMHLGTALAILVYFKRDVSRLFKGVSDFITRKNQHSVERLFAINFSIATIASVFLILVIKDFALDYGRNSTFIAFNLMFFGILMYIADRKIPQGLSMETSSQSKISLLVGASQALAIFPGVSRSGVTITAGRISGLSRLEASRFSFLLSLPIIFASVLYKSKEIIQSNELATTAVNVGHIAIGVTVSFIVGILTIHYFLKFLAKVGLGIYTIYRVILGVIILSIANF